MTELLGYIKRAEQFIRPQGPRYAVLELFRDCNFGPICKDWCQLPSQSNRTTEQTLEDTLRNVKFFADNKALLVTIISGEPLIDNPKFVTRDGITHYQHTLEAVRYIKEAGMTAGIVSNGSRVKDYMIAELADAGLDSLTFSYHIPNKNELDKLIGLAIQVGAAKIIPTITMLFKKQNAEFIPGVAAYSAQHGIPFATGLIQEFGSLEGLSQKNETSSLPSQEEQKEVFRALQWLHKFGMVRTSSSYMKGDKPVNRNEWTCNPRRNDFVKISATNELYRCHEISSGKTPAEIELLDNPEWQQIVIELVEGDGTKPPCQCGYECFKQAEDFNPFEYAPFGLIALLYKTGHSSNARWLGERAVALGKILKPNIDWGLKVV